MPRSERQCLVANPIPVVNAIVDNYLVVGQTGTLDEEASEKYLPTSLYHTSPGVTSGALQA